MRARRRAARRPNLRSDLQPLEVVRSSELVGALEEHKTAFGNLGDGERLVAQCGLFADVGYFDAGGEFHFLEVGERAIFLGVENLSGEDAVRLFGNFEMKRFG